MSTTDVRTTESAWHPVNIGHLVMGLAFLGIVAVWALVQGDVVQGRDIRWLLPLPWVLAGGAGLVATAIASRRRYGNRQTGWVGTTAEPGDDTARPGHPPENPASESPTPESTEEIR